MDIKILDADVLEQIVCIGEMLGPFYLKDPKLDGEIVDAFEALRILDVDDAAHEWPFLSFVDAKKYLSEMQTGLVRGISDDLIWEYRRLFSGPEPMPAPPWGSVYTDRECVVSGLSALELRKWLREVGITTSFEKVPEDHVGLMLLLMAWIARNKPGLLEEFLCRHFLTWSSHFLDELASAARQPFYRGLANLTKASLEGIQHEFSLTIEYPRYYR